jgi:hypothetical protein
VATKPCPSRPAAATTFVTDDCAMLRPREAGCSGSRRLSVTTHQPPFTRPGKRGAPCSAPVVLGGRGASRSCAPGHACGANCGFRSFSEQTDVSPPDVLEWSGTRHIRRDQKRTPTVQHEQLNTKVWFIRAFLGE